MIFARCRFFHTCVLSQCGKKRFDLAQVKGSYNRALILRHGEQREHLRSLAPL
jgi:hypothetical protein